MEFLQNPIRTLKKIYATLNRINHDASFIRQASERDLLLSGRRASWDIRNKKTIESLGEVEFRVYSQGGEDGIIDWLIENIPIKNTTFVEFGVENYTESNTRFLLQNRNWRGLIMDGNPEHMKSVAGEDIYWRHDLTAVPAFITRENINELLTNAGIRGDIGLLSVDIDGNDYWALDAITAISPRIIVCEYNAIFGDLRAVTIPYQPDFQRLSAHCSGQYYGASIKAFQLLMTQKGYEFVGTSTSGINAFFVRNDCFTALDGKIIAREALPSRHRDSRDEAGRLTFVRGEGRAHLIKDLRVVILDEGEDQRTAPIESVYPLYSAAWRRIIQ